MTKKTSVAIDMELLDAVREVLSTETIRETIERAFTEVLRVAARRCEVEALTAMRDLDLADDEVMAGAWRS